MTRVGILTGGGDCPGLNAVIRAAVRAGINGHGFELCGFRNGWAGVLAGDALELTVQSTAGILHRGGTILGTSRTNPFAAEQPDAGDGGAEGGGGAEGAGGAEGDGAAEGADGGPEGGTERIRRTLSEHRVDALIAVGGEDTLGVAKRLTDEGIPVVGVPKTIDNDLAGTDFTFGFQTAVQIATDAIDRLHTTAESHHRVIVVEVMGRHAGWIATYSGIAGGADAILVPERPFDVDEVCDRIRRRHSAGRTFSIVVVAEGASARGTGAGAIPAADTDAFGHPRLGGIAVALEAEIEQRTGFETRVTILGHVQRGGTPTAYDRVLATRFGVAAVGAVAAGRFGEMVALRGTEIVCVGLEEALREPKLLDPKLYETAEVFFG